MGRRCCAPNPLLLLPGPFPIADPPIGHLHAPSLRAPAFHPPHPTHLAGCGLSPPLPAQALPWCATGTWVASNHPDSCGRLSRGGSGHLWLWWRVPHPCRRLCRRPPRCLLPPLLPLPRYGSLLAGPLDAMLPLDASVGVSTASEGHDSVTSGRGMEKRAGDLLQASRKWRGPRVQSATFNAARVLKVGRRGSGSLSDFQSGHK